MTESERQEGEGERCWWCGRRFIQTPGPGRRRRYCRTSHRQRAYEARKLAGAHALGADQVLMAAARLEEIRDLIYRIEAALDDVDVDLGAEDSEAATRNALWHLYRACTDVRTVSLEPLAVGSGSL